VAPYQELAKTFGPLYPDSWSVSRFGVSLRGKSVFPEVKLHHLHRFFLRIVLFFVPKMKTRGIRDVTSQLRSSALQHADNYFGNADEKKELHYSEWHPHSARILVTFTRGVYGKYVPGTL
jgi:hypothetical protein